MRAVPGVLQFLLRSLGTERPRESRQFEYLVAVNGQIKLNLPRLNQPRQLSLIYISTWLLYLFLLGRFQVQFSK